MANDNAGSDVLKTYSGAIIDWIPVMQDSAYWLFGTLALIALVLEFGFKLLNNDIEFGSLAASLIRMMLIFGLFKAFLDWQWIYEIFRSFQLLGDKANAAAGISTKVSIDDLTDAAYELLGAMTDAGSWFHPMDSLALFLIGFVAVLSIIWLGVELLTTYVKFLILWALSPLFLALGVLNHTRQWALSAITAAMGAALEYMLIKLIIGLSIATVKDYAAKAMENDGSLFSLLIMTLLISGLARMAHGIASSMFSGHLGANNSAGFQAAKAVAGGAAAGAAKGAAGGGYAAVKAAAAAGGGGGGIKGAARMAGTALSGAAGGAMAGAAQGAFGKTHEKTGQASGVVASKAAAGIVNAAKDKLAGGGSSGGTQSSSGTTAGSSNKDRYGFDQNLLKDGKSDSSSSSMTGEVKPSKK